MNKNNPFRKEGFKTEKNKKASEWGKVKFNPVAKTATTEKATPWSHFKNELIEKQKDDEHESRNNLDSTSAKEFLKKREENYRKNLIESKRNEPTQWEDFEDETPPTSKSKKKKNSVPVKGKFQAIPSKIKNLETMSKKDFDSKLLTSQQNNFLKKIITRNTYAVKKPTFKQAVEDMKLNGVKPKPFKSKNK